MKTIPPPHHLALTNMLIVAQAGLNGGVCVLENTKLGWPKIARNLAPFASWRNLVKFAKPKNEWTELIFETLTKRPFFY